MSPTYRRFLLCASALIAAALAGVGCPGMFSPVGPDDGPVAGGIAGRLGEPMPGATDAQLEVFERGKTVFQRRFDLADGLGPTFNATSCGACHEKPVAGGKAGLYRNFFLGGRTALDGAFIFTESNGDSGGVIRMFHYGDGAARPAIPASTAIFAQRTALPLYGAGLLAEIADDEILLRADPDDSDGDGISGRANYDRGFVGRFGRKAQTVSIEGFIRGPLFNHVGVTTDPLTDEQRALLPVDSSAKDVLRAVAQLTPSEDLKRDSHAQAAAPDGPTIDADGVADPELGTSDLFDLVSFTMLLAAPEAEPLTERSNQGRVLFHQLGCSDCHVPRLNGPRGPIPAYSDLLLHDMGPDLADGIVMKEATGGEFRTQPLWGVAAAGPYLHDGRAATLEEAILAHGGESQIARDAFAALSDDDQADVLEFLNSLGGRDQTTAGLLPPDAPVPAAGEYGGPFRALDAGELTRFVRGRALFDRDFAISEGTGALTGSNDTGRYNGDSCRACHFDPAIGGAGPRDVNVMRHGTVDADGRFSPPSETPNTILHKEVREPDGTVAAEGGINVFEQRQTPHAFGLGFIESIPDDAILANADPDDSDGDGISGRAHILADGRVGRLGWKAQVPNIGEFVRDAMAAEVGLTIEAQPGLTFGLTADDDGVADPELTKDQAEDLAFFIRMLAPPPRQPGGDGALVAAGDEVFSRIGCARCHAPTLASALGDAHLYSDLLLHEILPAGTPGIEDGDAGQREFRTAPLWGLSRTAPYFHTGEADTIEQAIELHDAEAAAVRQEFRELSAADREALLAFLASL